MNVFIALLCHHSACVCRRVVLPAGLSCCLVYSVSAQENTVSEHTFGCILDLPKVRNTRINHNLGNSKRPCVFSETAFRIRNIPLEPFCNLFLMKPWWNISLATTNKRLGIFLRKSARRQIADEGKYYIIHYKESC